MVSNKILVSKTWANFELQVVSGFPSDYAQVHVRPTATVPTSTFIVNPIRLPFGDHAKFQDDITVAGGSVLANYRNQYKNYPNQKIFQINGATGNIQSNGLFEVACGDFNEISELEAAMMNLCGLVGEILSLAEKNGVTHVALPMLHATSNCSAANVSDLQALHIHAVVAWLQKVSFAPRKLKGIAIYAQSPEEVAELPFIWRCIVGQTAFFDAAAKAAAEASRRKTRRIDPYTDAMGVGYEYINYETDSVVKIRDELMLPTAADIDMVESPNDLLMKLRYMAEGNFHNNPQLLPIPLRRVWRNGWIWVPSRNPRTSPKKNVRSALKRSNAASSCS
jgi:hypothetical protein